ncbi:MAG: secretin N-terminal domain-containing protein [Burkholderiaceae bacterium]
MSGRNARSVLASILVVVVVAVVGAFPSGTRAQGPDAVTLNFKDADIDSVVGAFGHLLDRTFVIDPRVRGKITVETPRPVTRAEAYRLLLAALRLQGFAVVEAGSLSKVIPEADAKLQSGPVTASRTTTTGGDQVVTQIFRLNYESASALVPVLRPLIAPNNTIVAYPNNNSLVVTDYANNLRRIARIIATLDSPSTSPLEVIPVRNGLASELAVAVDRLLNGGGGQGAPTDAGQRVTVLADTRMNAIMIRAASAAKINLAKTLVARLDRPSSVQGNIHVVYLRNAEAAKLAQTLSAVLTGSAASTQPTSSVSASVRQATNTLNQARGPGQPGGATPATSPLGSASGGGGGSPVAVSAGEPRSWPIRPRTL